MAGEKNSKEAIKGDGLLQWDKIKISNSEKKKKWGAEAERKMDWYCKTAIRKSLKHLPTWNSISSKLSLKRYI